MKALATSWFRMLADRRGLAATEFAFIMPVMLVMFFGTVELSTGIAVDRKVTLVARTLSDMTSQAVSNVGDNELQNTFNSGIKILYPYPTVPITAQISEIYISSGKVATVQWSKAATVASNSATQATLATSSRSQGDVVTAMIPPGLLVAKTFLILSEVSYLYKPTIGYVMKSSLTLSDVSYTRPRQSNCITYNNLPDTSCPTP